MAASNALPETLRSITAIKIQELSKQQNSFESAKAAVLQSADKKTDILTRASILLEGACNIEGVRIVDDSSSDDEGHTGSASGDILRNRKDLLHQAKTDPSFSSTIVGQLADNLSRDLDLKSIKHEHAQLFSKLVTEWLSEPNELETRTSTSSSMDEDGASSFEQIGRKEMHEQRAQWESLVFSTSNVDAAAISSYLQTLFTERKTTAKALEDLRKQVKSFSDSFGAEEVLFDPASLETTIKGLMKTDLLSDEKSAILKSFLTNKEVINEVSDVLNMRMASIRSWKWSTGSSNAITLNMRKQLNGKYRVFMDEDVLDALLLHKIGMRWAVKFREVFTHFFASNAWLRSSTRAPRLDRERREYFLGKDQFDRDENVQSKRRSMYADDYFMTQLPIDEQEGARNYDDEDEDDNLGFQTSRKGPLETKHSLLHLLVTESLIARRLHGQFTVVRSDFKWFGPSLNHATIFAVLQFFGVNDDWLDFFKRFLEAPVKFSQDGPDAQIQIRRRGVPMSHCLSDVFGEVLMFCMDFAVNQSTGGGYLYRLHDDFWFWGQEKVCCGAWNTMCKFATIMGLQFNEEKTGTVRFGKTSRIKLEPTSSSDSVSMHDIKNLPSGEIRWGFLRLDAASARFVIDQENVDEHIEELKIQLSHCSSVFSYVQAYNAYLGRFFSNNFGKPSFAFGRDHVDMMIETFARIQKSMFPQGSVTDYLRSLIEERFGAKDLPDGFFYWPVRMGGLELHNPLIPLLGMRGGLRKTPARMLENALDRDETAYVTAKLRYEKTNTGNGLGRSNYELSGKLKDEEFMPMEEFVRYREEYSAALASVYMKFMSIPAERLVRKTAEVDFWLKSLPFTDSSKRGGRRRGKDSSITGIHSNFRDMDPYWKWVLAAHGEEIVKKYGGVRIVDEGMVPIGVVSVMSAKKIRWSG